MRKRLAAGIVLGSVMAALPGAATEITKDDCANIRGGLSASLDKLVKLSDQFDSAARSIMGHMLILSKQPDANGELTRLSREFGTLAKKLQSIDVDMAAESKAIETIRRLCG